MNGACIDFILNSIDPKATNIIDIGCGSGYLLGKIEQKFPAIKRTGFDIKVATGNETFNYVHGNIEKLPFEDNAFDVVMCSHTIEHLLQLDTCISELKRITKKQLFIVTPCQRFFYYTLDEHVNFFPYKEKLTAILPFENFECHKLQGDWAYLGTKVTVE
jgi:ubiquinone/menaquinone biosynthesis C-methylase UbiE